MVNDDVVSDPIGTDFIATLAGADLILAIPADPFLFLLGVLVFQLGG
jgi:hypothetical protein